MRVVSGQWSVVSELRRLFRSLRAALRLLRRRFGVHASACSGGTDIPVCPPTSEIQKSEISPTTIPAIELISTIDMVQELMRRCPASVIAIMDVQNKASCGVYGPGYLCRGLAVQALATVDNEIAKAQAALDEGSQS
jgi:hypothetical protein